MTYIKNLIMKGFKSFAKKTEIPLTPQINVILGPNGSGKSNISDALCFVLGRLNAKSLRATKSSNMIFMGNKLVCPAKEAFVELILDNLGKTFSLDSKEISIKRIVKKNGPSVYKINDEIKTRQEVLSLLAQAGIDPNGFNIVLQGEIQNFIKMHTEGRRKIIEEISGISIYEIRKEKSLSELKKTEDKLKEISTILRERTIYMNNLEKERQQALRFKKLEEAVKRYKASIILFDLKNKKKELEAVKADLFKKSEEKERTRKEIIILGNLIEDYESKINIINTTMKNSTGLEQEKINQEIADLRARLAGLNVNLENNKTKLKEIIKQKSEAKENFAEINQEIERLQKETPHAVEKRKEIEKQKSEFEKLEIERKKFYIIKSELKTIKNRFEDKKSMLTNYNQESRFLLEQIKSLSKDLFDRKSDSTILNTLKTSLVEKKEFLEKLEKQESELEKISYSNEHEMENQNSLMLKISNMDVCPVCKSKITDEHIHTISHESQEKIDSLKRDVEMSDKRLGEILQKKKILKQDIEQINSEISKRESDLIILSNIEDKKNQIKSLQEKIDFLNKEILEIEKKKVLLEKQIKKFSDIENKYEETRLKIQDTIMINEEDLSSEVSFKQRDLERLRSLLRKLSSDEEELKEEIEKLHENIYEKEKVLQQKNKQEEELSKKFKQLISKRDELQRDIRDKQIKISKHQSQIHSIEEGMNNLKIEEAKFSAEFENLKIMLHEFEGVEKVKASKEVLMQKLSKVQSILSRIGSVNMRSLELYDSVKNEYESIKEKIEVIHHEKQGILEIVKEIDLRKKKTFLKTFNGINEKFSKNFDELNSKGKVSLELENKKEPFEGGVNIIVKMGHGKYFDIASLSGGEQTMVALSLIFAIQELKPYPFYLLDEIDAALDKRNSERLALLLKKYMEKGQYITITHNDEVILNAKTLYGVSMNDGISKIISLKI